MGIEPGTRVRNMLTKAYPFLEEGTYLGRKGKWHLIHWDYDFEDDKSPHYSDEFEVIE